MHTDEKVRENYCRRQAKRVGLFLRKSKAKKTNIDDWGGYMIINPLLNTIEAGQKFDLSLEGVEKFLNEAEEELIKSRK